MSTEEAALYIRHKHGRPYLVRRYRDHGLRREQWEPLTDIDREILEEALRIKQELRDQIVELPCQNPDCPHTVTITRRQLHEFMWTYPRRYDLRVVPFCSKACRDKVLQETEKETENGGH